LGCAIFFALGLQGNAVAADAPFYQGKSITVIEGRAPGGVGSVRVQAVTRHLQKQIPGNPPFAFQFMSGGGGTAAANFLATTAKRDGLTIANVGTGVYSNAIFGAPGVRYKLDDFVFLGSATSGGPYTLILRPGLNLNTAEKLKAQSGLRFANRTVGHTMYILDRLIAFVLELKDPRWVLGYNDDEINLALDRGEADGRTHILSTIVKEGDKWFKGGYAFPVVLKNTQGKGAETVRGFPQGLQTLDQFADTEIKRAILKLHDASRPGSSVFFAPKGMPEPALRALKDAFNKLWQDPEFLKEYQTFTGEPPDPITGEEIEGVLAQIPQDPKIVEVYKQIIGAGPLPPGR
jgi:tripartite-type tricarboxylate transporter receptor subunit TctC